MSRPIVLKIQCIPSAETADVWTIGQQRERDQADLETSIMPLKQQEEQTVMHRIGCL